VKTTGDGFLAIFDGPTRAVECAKAIVGDIPSLDIEVRAVAYSLCGQEVHDLEEAAALLRRSLQLFAAPETWGRLADVLAQRKATAEEALDAATRALDGGTRDPLLAYRSRAWAHELLGRNDAALRALTMALAHVDESTRVNVPNLLLLRIRLLGWLGRHDDALREAVTQRERSGAPVWVIDVVRRAAAVRIVRNDRRRAPRVVPRVDEGDADAEAAQGQGRPHHRTDQQWAERPARRRRRPAPIPHARSSLLDGLVTHGSTDECIGPGGVVPVMRCTTLRAVTPDRVERLLDYYAGLAEDAGKPKEGNDDSAT